ncbi:Tetratricopeptide repeat [Plasmodiophora brassicae]
MAPVKSPALPHVLARLLQPNASKAARDPPTGSTIADQAGRLIIQGRCGDAFTILDNAIKKARPTINTRFLSGLYCMRGVAAAGTGDLERALSDICSAISINPDNCEALNSRAMHYLDMGDLTAALADIDRAIALVPSAPRFYSTRSAIYLQLGDIARARLDCDMVIELDPQFPEAYANRAVCNCMDDPPSLSLALKDVTFGIDMDPSNAALYKVRAGILFLLDRKDDSLADMDVAVSLRPADMKLRALRGDMHARNGELGAAIADFTAVIEARPDMLDAVIARGQLHADKEDWKEALADYDSVLSVEPDNVDALVGLAWVKFCTSAMMESAQTAMKCIQLASADKDKSALYVAHFIIGMVATYQQRNEDAVAAFTSALSFDSSSLSARANRANCLLDLERYTEANQDASVCVRKEPCCEYFLLRSRARLGLRQLKNGLKDAEQALRLDPNCIQAHLVSARFHVALGDLDHALADCDAGLAIEPGNDGLRNFRASISDTLEHEHQEPSTKRRRVGKKAEVRDIENKGVVN